MSFKSIVFTSTALFLSCTLSVHAASTVDLVNRAIGAEYADYISGDDISSSQNDVSTGHWSDYVFVYDPLSTDSRVAEASQTSDIASTGTHFFATSEAGAGMPLSDYGITSAYSSFVVQFTVDQSYMYALSGTVGGYVTDLGGVTTASDDAFVSLTDVGHFSNGTFDVTGVLSPGTYWLEAHTSNTASRADAIQVSSGLYDLTLTLQPVPIPPAVWLFGSGLIGLVGLARRKKS